jgi:hydrogenase maturation protease
MLKVIGIGNCLRGDDGIGSIVIERLRQEIGVLPVNLYDVGSDAFSVLEHLVASQPILIVDCAKMGEPPGTVKKMMINNASMKTIDKMVSLHGIGFAEVFQLARRMGAIAPCSLVGVEPKSVAFNTGLSKEVKEAIPKIINLVVEESHKYAEKNINH